VQFFNPLAASTRIFHYKTFPKNMPLDFPLHRDIARQLIDLDFKAAAVNRPTNMLSGGRRYGEFVQPGNSGAYPSLKQPQAVAEYAGFQYMKPVKKSARKPVVTSDSEDSEDDEELEAGVRGNYIHDDVDPLESGGVRGFRKGSKSKTRPGRLDFVTHKGSKFHDIDNHYVKELGVPFVGGRRKPNIGKSILHGLQAFDKSNLGQALEQAAITAGTTALMAAGRDPKKSTKVAKDVLRSVGKGANQFVNSDFAGKIGSAAVDIGTKVALKKLGLGRPKRAPTARHLLVRKIMTEKKLSLPQASSYIKQHNLY